MNPENKEVQDNKNILSWMNETTKKDVAKREWDKITEILPKAATKEEMQRYFKNRVEIYQDNAIFDKKGVVPMNEKSEIFKFESEGNKDISFMVYNEIENNCYKISIDKENKLCVTQTIPSFSLIYQES
ncbi:MAG: hypothetical protein ACD_3C00110G0002 [uncultured bacterium (gcode 4)]|uniref:Uncharacterized protein n=1 Tax=uncultured bacterium (gcode 4) TaxID=1234023 RepID=K2GCS0_9BACT|nr:MAG: hypothetical protein ACD_3C00110G0002 [uncultured bacterium (gcode 4)]